MESTPVSSSSAEFETRLFETSRPGALLPYAWSAIRTVGSGSVEVAEGKGLQITLPPHSLHHLLGTLDALVQAGFPACQGVNVYAPPVRLDPQRAGAAIDIVRSLSLCPQDMHVATVVVASGDDRLLFVSGPPDRAAVYTATVLPALRAVLERPIKLLHTDTTTSLKEITLTITDPLPQGDWDLRFDGQPKAKVSDGPGRVMIVLNFDAAQTWMETPHLQSHLRLLDLQSGQFIVE